MGKVILFVSATEEAWEANPFMKSSRGGPRIDPSTKHLDPGLRWHCYNLFNGLLDPASVRIGTGAD
jgi:hypothetical protein